MTAESQRLYVTGATGFVGSAVVRSAVAAGHEVVAVVRPASRADDFGPGVSPARVDLRSAEGLAESLEGVETVIHLAAAKSGDYATQFAGTVVATENLLQAMEEAGVKHLVGISTFSVYDYRGTPSGTVLDEDSPIDLTPDRRDEYARTKLIQEDLYRAFADRSETNRSVILRPGMIYGPDNLWHALLGTEFGPRYLRIGSRATLPMIYVENCAEAIVAAAQHLTEPGSGIDGEVINLVDDDLPSQAAYAEAVAARTETPPSITVPWSLVRFGTGTLDVANQKLLKGRAKFPGIAVADRVHARFKPLRYTNAKAKALLGWTPRFGLIEAIERSVAVERARADGADEPVGSSPDREARS